MPDGVVLIVLALQRSTKEAKKNTIPGVSNRHDVLNAFHETTKKCSQLAPHLKKGAYGFVTSALSLSPSSSLFPPPFSFSFSFH